MGPTELKQHQSGELGASARATIDNDTSVHGGLGELVLGEECLVVERQRGVKVAERHVVRARNDAVCQLGRIANIDEDKGQLVTGIIREQQLLEVSFADFRNNRLNRRVRTRR